MSKKPKKKKTAAQKREKAYRRLHFQWIFVNGKQVRVRRPPTIDGLSIDDFIRRNADPIWLHENGLWEYMVEALDPHERLDEDEPRWLDDSPIRLDGFLLEEDEDWPA